MSDHRQAPPVSVVIITKDEEGRIERCLETVRWAAEVIVVDAYSGDRTVELAKRMGARVFQREWAGYSVQKNFAIAQATQPWILSLDADEQVSPALANEIQARLPLAREVAFTVPVPLYFLGRKLGYYFRRSAGYVRLFRRDRGGFNDALVHETVQVSGPIGELKAPLLHDSYASP
ncbi:MAG: glycosyltransferase family 2 protein, partial [Actinomycetota bacterium]|nr:glycosyltransferase family 2 protein [Actinomycetota bacterium]